MDLHALLLEGSAGEFRDLLILDGQNAVEHFNDGRFRAQRIEKAGKFDADRAGADHQQRFRHDVREERLPIGPDQLAVRLKAGKRPRAGAGRQNDVLGGKSGTALPSLPAIAILPCLQPAVPSKTVILCFFIRKPTPFDSRAATLRERSTIFFQVEGDGLGGKAEFVEPVQQVIDFRRPQQRFGRDAAPIEAYAAEIFALDDGGLHAELGGADRGDIAARP